VRLTVMAALFVALVLSMLALKSQRDELLAANVSVESRNLGGSSSGNVSRQSLTISALFRWRLSPGTALVHREIVTRWLTCIEDVSQ
jgi:hypothetical protein